MAHPSKNKGDKAERECADLLHDLLGVPARRKLGAGRQDDQGDLDGIPDLTVQVAAWSNVGAAVSQKPAECEQQQQRAGTAFGATFCRIRGGRWVVALTPAQFAELYREATS